MTISISLFIILTVFLICRSNEDYYADAVATPIMMMGGLDMIDHISGNPPPNCTTAGEQPQQQHQHCYC